MPEASAEGATREIYAEIRQALGLPDLAVFYPALAVYPQFLQAHWKLFEPVARSRELRDCAERLRADAYTRAHNYFRIPVLSATAADLKLNEAPPRELTVSIDFFLQQDALLLLLFSAQLQALEGPVGRAAQPTPADPSEATPEKPSLVGEANAPAAVRRIYDEMRRILALPYVNTEYQALANWPDFLKKYWDMLQAVMQSPLYQECRYRVREFAWSLTRDLPGPLEMSLEQLGEAGLGQEDVSSIGRILELFVNNLSGLALNLAVAKIALEGGNQQLQPAAAGKPGRAA